LILTNQEVLILTSDFVPFQKIPLSSQNPKFIKLLPVSATKTLLIFESFIFSLQLEEGKIACENSEMSLPVINASVEGDKNMLILLQFKNDSEYILSHFSLATKCYQYMTEICLDLENRINLILTYIHSFLDKGSDIKVSFVLLETRVLVLTHNQLTGENKISQLLKGIARNAFTKERFI
jgi:hypothetical protein